MQSHDAELPHESEIPPEGRAHSQRALHWYALVVMAPSEPGRWPGTRPLTKAQVDGVIAELPEPKVVHREKFEDALEWAISDVYWGRKMQRRWVTSTTAQEQLGTIAFHAEQLREALTTASTRVRHALERLPTWPPVMVHRGWVAPELAALAFLHQLERLQRCATSREAKVAVTSRFNTQAERPKRRAEDFVKDTFVSAMFDLYGRTTGTAEDEHIRGKHFHAFVTAALGAAGLHEKHYALGRQYEEIYAAETSAEAWVHPNPKRDAERAPLLARQLKRRRS